MLRLKLSETNLSILFRHVSELKRRKRRFGGFIKGSLHGIPLKDNFELELSLAPTKEDCEKLKGCLPLLLYSQMVI